jgi:1-acyl-sn-glycerol-3-phosphate acyltransferase
MLYALYAWTLFLLLGAAVVPVLLLTPSLARRRAMVRATGRCVLRLIGMRLQVRGIERIGIPSVVVANHASYLDGVVLQAVLPPSFSFVIKRNVGSTIGRHAATAHRRRVRRAPEPRAWCPRRAPAAA